MTKRSKAIISLIFVMLVWGSSFSVTKIAVATLPPVYFAFLRFAVASVILLAISITGRSKTAAPVPIGIITLMALSGITLYYIFFNFSLGYTAASTGALLEGFIPIIIAILAAIFLKEKLVRGQWLGILISVAGVVLVGFVDLPKQSSPNPFLGNFLMIVCIFLWSAYTVLSKKVAAFDALTIISYTTYIGTLLLIPAVLFELHNKSWPMPSSTGWAIIVYLGAIGSALCYFLYSRAMEQLSAAQVGNFLNLDPVTGAGLAVLLLHEKISAWQVAGCVCILTGVWLSTKAHNAPAKPAR